MTKSFDLLIARRLNGRPTPVSRPRAMTVTCAVVVSVTLAGCGKKPSEDARVPTESGDEPRVTTRKPEPRGEPQKGGRTPPNGRSEPRAVTPATTEPRSEPTAGSPDKKTVEKRLKDNLPAGYIHLLVYSGDPDEFIDEVSWSRPGFPNNAVTLTVRVDGRKVQVEGSKLGIWDFEDGKLKKEVTKGATEAQWEFLQKRAKEVADATYKALR